MIDSVHPAHKIKAKAKYNLSSNTPALLSAAGYVPHAETATASLVAISPTNSKFSHLQK